ncbi:MAG TPA: MBOAT family protein [Candidatus Merdivicinus excrementipullorum]|uniref:MBOAT family protein n=1 Tax=Candidatus Merdivicinus excrementipullorum TaxID=2840867 RepID=A0A9D1FKS7_9FIRM|nr:MBOAT family protein [Candidatus Merdivicinus excrementipullorum]
MVFSSIPFLYVFLPVVLLIYFLCPMSRKNLVLMVSGFLFYAWGEPVYVLLMLFSTLLDYTAGRVMERYRENPKIRKAALLTSVIINLSLLAVFKYSSFLVENINALFGISLFNPDLPLPIGISFYTFQSMSYTIDLYRGDTKMQKSYINYAAYVSMFPQLVAGPIVRYDDVAAELENRTITLDKIGEGAFLFAQGLAKKVLLANNIGILWTNVKEMATAGSVPAVTAWLGILAFTFQIYFDFSGYSDMARGMGRMLGFDFPDNFRYPYMSKSITDFWRRWHMTLGSWFRSYVYIPLGGNRKGTARTIRNLLITWMLTGLWHGASWNFLLWGLYFGVLLIIEKFFLGKYLEKLPGWLQQTYSFLLVVFGWVLFEMETPALIGGFFGSMVGFGGFADKYSVYLLASYGLLMVLCMIASNNWVPRLVEMAGKKFPRVVSGCKPVYIVLALVFGTAFLVNSTYNPFLYFRF